MSSEVIGLKDRWQELEPEEFKKSGGDVFAAMRSRMWIYGHDARPGWALTPDGYRYRAWVIPWGSKRPVVRSEECLETAMLGLYVKWLGSPPRR